MADHTLVHKMEIFFERRIETIMRYFKAFRVFINAGK